MPLEAETSAKRCKNQKTKQNPSSQTSLTSPWGRSHTKPIGMSTSKNKSNDKRRTGESLIAHRISQPSGPSLLARINQDQNESQPITAAHRRN
ncbi:uncharacterized protein PGTG_22468 [Puccinia graminis f. sp. tritici CRL 75-36-700-3]|uniref:Uncharacterized protein n=1 Tax=Puccinia graminis f. sp. tritici (strain CRL 75-36-700-3 / race SCCL) TaxID=418459 RepID=H6QUR8_PUCGT|nr:uncharacterized protein PGTG_22468 [Puccinia graminis f. sp. tritici CRL 75-36-700-3]EHS64826.1 hypothetical protein PGTG_22468 [Puccinia graminis f. sp. tritici CRL 75-36-700-3]